MEDEDSQRKRNRSFDDERKEEGIALDRSDSEEGSRSFDDERKEEGIALDRSDGEDDIYVSPQKIQQVYAAQKNKCARVQLNMQTQQRRSPYSDAFSFVLLKQCFLVVVTINMTSQEHAGYGYDLDLGLRSGDATLRDLNLFGPYNQVSATGGPIQERSLIPGDTRMYNAQCYIMIPKVDKHGRYGPRTIKEQVQELADYCSSNYHCNITKRRKDSNKSYPIVQRTFGLADDPMTTDSMGRLSSYLTRDSCLFHLTFAQNFGPDFYGENEELAKQLLSPPYSVREQMELGYPAPEQM